MTRVYALHTRLERNFITSAHGAIGKRAVTVRIRTDTSIQFRTFIYHIEVRKQPVFIYLIIYLSITNLINR